MAGLCEGTVTAVNTVWSGTDLTNLPLLGLGLFMGQPGQTVWSYLTSAYPSQALAYPNLAYVGSTQFQLGSNASLPNFNFEVFGNLAGTATTVDSQDAAVSQIVLDYLTNTRYGYALPTALVGDITALDNWCQSLGIGWSPNLATQEQGVTTLDRWASLSVCWFFWDGLQIQFLPLTGGPVSGNGYSYTPNTTPVYDLGYSDFIVSEEGKPPIEVDRIDPLDGYNTIQLDVKDRLNNYNNTSVTWQDQGSCDDYGQLQSNVVQANEICRIEVANVVAPLIGQRLVNIRNTYKFTLGAGFILLMVGDIVTLTDPLIGLALLPVRIKELEENDEGLIQVTAEEFPAGQGSPPMYPTQTHQGGGTTPNTAVQPPMVNPPAIFEPSPLVTAGTPEVWVALSGGAHWGGAYVYLSFDNLSYTQIGVINAASYQGVTTAALGAVADPDTTSTLAIDLTESLSVLPGAATHGDADNQQTLALIDQELVAYGSVIPTGTYTSNLTYLRRGLLGTAVAAHAAGAAFCRIDQSIVFTYDLPVAYVGKTLYFKFCSFNEFIGQTQDISTVATYTYTPTGTAYTIGAPSGIVVVPSRRTQADGTTLLSLATTWTASTGPMLANYEVQSSVDGGTTWQDQGAPTQPALTFGPVQPNANFLVRARAVSQSGLATSAWATSASTSSGALVAAAPSAVAAPAATASNGGYSVSWTASTDPTILYYTVYQAQGAGQPFSAAVPVATVPAPATSATVTGQNATTVTTFVVPTNAAGAGSPSTGQTVTPTIAAVTGQPYDILGFYNGSPATSLTMYRLQMVRAVTLPASLTGSRATCTVAPTSATVSLVIRQNGTSIGTISYSPGSTVGSFNFSSAVTLAAGDILEVDMGSTGDAGFTGPSWSIVGTR